MDAIDRRAVLLRAGLTTAIALAPTVMVALTLSVDALVRIVHAIPELPFVAAPFVVALVVPVVFWWWTRRLRSVGQLLAAAVGGVLAALLLWCGVFAVVATMVMNNWL